jgi:hypothetical protein
MMKKKNILYLDYLSNVLDSNYDNYDDMKTTVWVRFYIRGALLLFFFIVLPILLLFKLFKDESKFFAEYGLEGLFLPLIPAWLFLGFPVLSSISVHECVIDDQNDRDQYYTWDSIWKIHTFQKVDEEVE